MVSSKDASKPATDLALRQLIEAGDWRSARRLCKVRLTNDDGDAVAWLTLGLSHLMANQAPAAEKALLKAHKLSPRKAEVLNALAALYLAQKQPLKALAHTDEAVRRHPKNVAARGNHIWALIQLERIPEAVKHVDVLLSLDPTSARTRALAGRVFRSVGRYDTALSYFLLLLKEQPDDLMAQVQVACCRYLMGDRGAAQAGLDAVLAQAPDDAHWYTDVGSEIQQAATPVLALQCFRAGLARHPQDIELLMNVAISTQALGNPTEALYDLQRAVAVDKNCAAAWYHMALSHQALRDHAAMVKDLEACLEIDPGYAAAAVMLAGWKKERGGLADAKVLLRRALDADPGAGSAYIMLANFLIEEQLFEEAEALLDEAQALGLEANQLPSVRASLLLKRGDITKANRIYREILKGQPDSSEAMSGLLFTSNYDPELSPEDRAKAYFSWNDRFARWRAPKADHRYANRPTYRRKLRLGYVSGDFKHHSVAFFFEPLLNAHDRDRFELYLYANQRGGDHVTQRMMQHGDHWRWTVDLSDEAVAEMIRLDEIDILIDLSNHTAYHRLGVFALKPAPVQMTTLGMPTTTGLSAIDWRITDEWMDPPGLTEALHSEKLLRIASGWCYTPPTEGKDLPVEGLPALQNGHLTFASFNAFGKINPKVFRLWGRLLKSIPNAVLLVATGGKDDDELINETVRKTCADCGVPMDRLRLMGRKPMEAYFREHGKVDVLLDSFPYTGATVTAHALWMGVPVITLAGSTSIHRSATSMMNAVGLPEFVAESPAEYVSIAKYWSQHIDELAEIRQALRPRMQKSVLMDGRKVTRSLETELRRVWRDWCEENALTKDKKGTSK